MKSHTLDVIIGYLFGCVTVFLIMLVVMVVEYRRDYWTPEMQQILQKQHELYATTSTTATTMYMDYEPYDNHRYQSAPKVFDIQVYIPPTPAPAPCASSADCAFNGDEKKGTLDQGCLCSVDEEGNALCRCRLLSGEERIFCNGCAKEISE